MPNPTREEGKPGLWAEYDYVTEWCAKTGKPRFRAYWKRGDGHVRASRPMTVAEFKTVRL